MERLIMVLVSCFELAILTLVGQKKQVDRLARRVSSVAPNVYEGIDLRHVWCSVPLVSPLQVCFSWNAHSRILVLVVPLNILSL